MKNFCLWVISNETFHDSLSVRFNTFISLATDMCTLDNNNDYYNVYYIKP